MNGSTMSDGSLLELVPQAQLELQHVPIVVRNRRDTLPTYRFQRPPRIQDLQQLKGLWSIWQENQTLILTDEPAVHGIGLLVYHDPDTSSIRCVTLGDSRCFWFSSGSLHCTIIGKSDHAIAETAAVLWDLDTDSRFREVRCWNEHFNFGVFSTQQLALLFRNSPMMEITLEVSNISAAQSEFLAQMPFPISLTLEDSLHSFSDCGHAFVNKLLRRDSPFGSLKLWKVEETQNDMFQRLLKARTVQYLELGYATPQQIVQLLSASSKGVGFAMKVEDSLQLDWSRVDIVPKELNVELSYREIEAHIVFMCSFFRRLAELEHLKKFGVTIFRELHAIIPSIVFNELLSTVAANHSLEELHLQYAHNQPVEHRELLFAMMECHAGLRRFQSPETFDPGYTMLKQLLNRNRFIEVLDRHGNRVTDGDEIDQIYRFNRFYQDCQGLKRGALSLLPPLVGEVLVGSASGDYQQSAFLMANYTDALCELVQYSSLFQLEEHDSSYPEELM
ncbi:hypothetical protein FisN_12Hu066 [Fistulifera solaris]|uniref:Uncharacterized protein n=1 Tax=Fistulifera solaris TaxID=1519565 RepID=A0A1Z5K1R4_FISSO|nr:hypothetical protein FisN_12Hu066 [Fistulifera solaris]|eukprot:GAX20220.1 hypothetical protein FisN_12Hu066 [Fistulifera solaris]